VEHLHYLIEAFKLAVAERDTHVCDPAFHAVPVDALLSKAYARDQAARIDPQRVLGYPLASNLRPHRDTVYLTVVDRDRNAVSLINSLYYPFGSLLVAGDTGVTLQNRGAGFVLDPEHANCIAPRKRPLHTIIPAMAYRNGKPLLAFGVMGGEYQAMGHAYVFSNWLDFGLDLQEAIDAPRFLPGLGVVAVERSLPAASCEALRRRGHVVVESDTALGGAQAIYIDNEAGVLQAASDPRKDGCALGY
jgi:gamma-glutamyltranspeptidase/glutathione hydrolase